MNRDILNQVIKDENFKTIFDFDELGMTWQISHIRMVGGTKKVYESKEHFYLSLIKVVEMEKNLTYGLSNWQHEVDLKQWCAGLIFEVVEKSKFNIDVIDAFQEIEQYKEDWTREDEPTFYKENVIIPKQITAYWFIKETVNFRLPCGETEGFLAESPNGYFYIEFHMAS